MPTFLLLLVLLTWRVLMAVARGIGHVVALPARTALALAPHARHARWLLVGGATASVGLGAIVLGLLLRSAR